MIYATTEELLAQWTADTLPADPEGLLEAASALAGSATIGAVYPTFTDGHARDPRIRDALRRAVIAQVKFWHANDLDPAAGTLAEETTKVVSSKSIKGASVSYDTGAAASAKAARAAALTTLCPAAFSILEVAGLVRGVARVW